MHPSGRPDPLACRIAQPRQAVECASSRSAPARWRITHVLVAPNESMVGFFWKRRVCVTKTLRTPIQRSPRLRVSKLPMGLDTLNPQPSTPFLLSRRMWPSPPKRPQPSGSGPRTWEGALFCGASVPPLRFGLGNFVDLFRVRSCSGSIVDSEQGPFWFKGAPARLRGEPSSRR